MHVLFVCLGESTSPGLPMHAHVGKHICIHSVALHREHLQKPHG